MFGKRSGHAAVSWGTKVVVVGGYHEDEPRPARTRGASAEEENAEPDQLVPELDAWVLDTETSEWARLALRGPAPVARGGHTATLVRGEAGGKIVVFGGEDRRGRLLDDVHVIDLAAKTWVAPRTTGAAPAARAGHVAASFGSGSRAVTDVYKPLALACSTTYFAMEQLAVEKELAEEKAEELTLDLETAKMEAETAIEEYEEWLREHEAKEVVIMQEIEQMTDQNAGIVEKMNNLSVGEKE